MSMKLPIRLRGISGDVKGRTWEADSVLRAGRLSTLEIVLDDGSVSRRHAELRRADSGWFVRDMDSTNGTYVNGIRLTSTAERQVQSRDIVQFGKVAMMVELNEPSNRPHNPGLPLANDLDDVAVESALSSSWEDGVSHVFFDQNQTPRALEQLQALIQAGQHAISIESEQELLTSILNDAVNVLEAQRGAIVLQDPLDNVLRLRALATAAQDSVNDRHPYSRKLAQKVFAEGHSLLCGSVEEEPEMGTNSVIHGAMSSVMCVLLRTPRKRLGIIHLDRNIYQKRFTKEDLRLADALAATVSMGIESAQLLRRQREMFLNTINVLAQAVELRDQYTGGHTARVTAYATLLATHLKLGPREMELIRLGTPLHDIGKIGIDDAILRKPGRLDPQEFEMMKSHTTKGAAILSTISELQDVIPIVKHHHERWDGSGYPTGLKGENIPLLARIVAVADSFDAMTSNRPYHKEGKGMPTDKAFEEIRRCTGSHFDPHCAQAFLEIHRQIEECMQANKQTSFLPIKGMESHRV